MDVNDYYIQIAPRSSLCCIICTVDPNEIRDSSAKSFFHWKTLKCRLIINILPQTVIASPISNAKGSFFVITTNDCNKRGELQNTLKKLNLTYTAPQIVTPKAYIDCMKYTFEFYLSPMWNKVSQIYLEGVNFLKNSDFNDAVICKIDLVSKETSAEDEIKIGLIGITAKLPPMRLEDLAIPSTMIGDFLLDSNGVIDVSIFGTQRVTIVPSMRKGIVNRILKNIPSSCPFKNYQEIRRHWKNMYGYRLPKTNDGILYYEVYFPIPNVKVDAFIYPDICIRKEMIQIPTNNSNNLKKKFLQDLCSVIPKMLNRPLQIFEKSQQSHLQSENFENLSAMDSMTFETPIRSNYLLNSGQTTRLSFSGGQPMVEKQLTTQMSPTPSLSGEKCENVKKLNFKSLKKNHENQSTEVSKNPENLKKNIKIFLTQCEKSEYFKNLTEIPEKQKIKIFLPPKRKKENTEYTVTEFSLSDLKMKIQKKT